MMMSMTAFSRQQLQDDWGALAWEIRSVNHRYLETSVRLPEAFRSLEGAVREAVRKTLNRGKVECQLRFHAAAPEESALQLNEQLIFQLLQANKDIENLTGTSTQISSVDILRWPGVILEQEPDAEMLQKQALSLLHQALDDLVASRQREGEALKAMLEQRISSIREIVARVRESLPEVLRSQHQGLVDKLADLKAELEPNRLEQEIALLAQKADVAEELDRLESHLNECARVLETRGQKGRRLDFLMQELNREANTLSSKAVLADTTLNAVELKVLIEQMREQIQNIE